MKMSNLGNWVSVGLLLEAPTSARAASLPGGAKVAAHEDEPANAQLVEETEHKADRKAHPSGCRIPTTIEIRETP